MKIKQLMLAGLASTAMAVFTLPLAAARVGECVAGKPTAASYIWDFHREANGIFQEVESDARQALDHAAQLQSFALSDSLSWESHADQLTQLKAEVNDMGVKLCRLETIRRVVAPWQQKIIDQMASSVRLLADNTQDAILFGDSNRRELWSPTYRKYVDNLYNEAQTLTRSAGEAVEYARVLQQYGHLRKDLGIEASS